MDYSKIFGPVVRHSTMRLILSLATSHYWKLRQLDIKNTLLHIDLHEEVYMHQPQKFVDSKNPSHVCKLINSIYGLKQAHLC